MNKLIEAELKKVEVADLSNFDPKTNTYFIPQRKEIKIEEDNCYLIHIKKTLFFNDVLKVNWNNNSLPQYEYLKIDVSKKMAKMIRVVAVGYDFENDNDLN